MSNKDDRTERDLLVIRECYAYGRYLGECKLTSDEAKNEIAPYIQSICQDAFESCLAVAAGRIGYERSASSEPLTEDLIDMIYDLSHLFGLTLLLNRKRDADEQDDEDDSDR